MPVRMVDGDKIWTSSTLRKLPEKYRMHYANWLPLAEANGTFEADPEIIHRTIYSFLMKSVTVREVRRILSLFQDLGLVKIWQEGGKTWGFFSGMEKPGRLPSQSELKKYKHLPPTIPRELLDKSKNSRAWFGLEGLGKEGSAPSLSSSSANEENEMSSFEGGTARRIRKKLAKIWQEVKKSGSLDLPEPHPTFMSQWRDIAEHCSEDALLSGFRMWAEEEGDGHDAKPMNAFVLAWPHYRDRDPQTVGLTPRPEKTVDAEQEARIQENIRKQKAEHAKLYEIPAETKEPDPEALFN